MAGTIKEIAKLSGVSRGTVDRVLNERGHVDPAKAEIVRRVAQELGYQPNLAGRALAVRKKSYAIGVLLSSQGNPFFQDVIRGVEAAGQALQQYRVRIVLHTVKGYDPLLQAQLLRELGARTDAVALSPVNHPSVVAAINELVDAGVPVVTLNTDLEGSRRLCYVGSDYKAGGRVACGLLGLLTGGRAHFGILTGSPRVLGHNQRIAGFRAVMEKRFPAFQLTDIAATEDDDAVAFRAARNLLTTHPETDALYLTAAGVPGVCRAVQQLRPDDPPKIVCFDATPQICSLIYEGWVQAAVTQQPFQQGESAVRVLFERLLTGELPAHRQVLMQHHIVIRENLPE